MIFKLQRPLNWATGRPTTDGNILAYTEDGSVHLAVRQSPDVLAMFADQPNLYVRASHQYGGLRITGIVEDQLW